jgi:hypothetical protein
MKFTKTLSILAIATVLSACGPEKVSQDIVDQNMTTTRLNAQKNASVWYSTVYPEGVVDVQRGKPIRILAQSDSTVAPSCRNGDGWASAIVNFEGGKTLDVKCQTNGSGKGIAGCMTKAEFETKTYKSEEGTCANLETLEKFK